MKVAELEALLDLDDSRFQRGMDGVDNRTSGLGGKVGAAGAVAVGAFAAMGAAAGAFGISAINAGSDLSETMSKNTAVFKDQAKAIEGWADNAADDFGQSKQQALDAAGSFGNLFVQLGIGRDKAGEMSKSMVELASDFASFHNADISEVLGAQTAAFRGEYDALQRFVPTINAAAVEQEALAMTHKKTTAELTAQEKALATQSLMLKGAGDAAGDFDRTNTGLANRMRIAQGKWADFRAELGMKLLPVLLDAWDLFDQKIVPAVERMSGVLDGGKGAVSDFMDGFKNGTDDVNSNQSALAAWGAEAYLQVTNYSEAWSEAKETIASIWENFTEIGSAFFGTFQEWMATHQEKIDEWYMKVEEIFLSVANVVALVFEAIRVAFDVVTAIVLDIWDRFGGQLVDHIATHIDAVLQVLQGALDIIMGVLNIFIGVFTGDWDRAWNGVKQVFSGVWDVIVGLARMAINGVSTVIGLGMAVISSAWSFVWNSIKTLAGAVWGEITAGVSSGINSVVEIVKGLPGKVSSAASGAFDSVKEAFKSAINWIIGKWNSLGFTLPEIEFAGQHIGGNTVSTPDIPMLASGGRIIAPGLAIVGENGPEIRRESAGASILPLDRMMNPGPTEPTVVIERLEINANDADEFLAVLPELERALQAGVGRNDRNGR